MVKGGLPPGKDLPGLFVIAIGRLLRNEWNELTDDVAELLILEPTGEPVPITVRSIRTIRTVVVEWRCAAPVASLAAWPFAAAAASAGAARAIGASKGPGPPLPAIATFAAAGATLA